MWQQVGNYNIRNTQALSTRQVNDYNITTLQQQITEKGCKLGLHTTVVKFTKMLDYFYKANFNQYVLLLLEMIIICTSNAFYVSKF